MKLKKQLKHKSGDRYALINMADSEIHAQKMAEAIHKYALEHGEPAKDKVDFYLLDIDETAKVINEYLQNEI